MGCTLARSTSSTTSSIVVGTRIGIAESFSSSSERNHAEIQYYPIICNDRRNVRRLR
eukprot:COSAG06_NODE_65378_length_257_cov_0.651899_1_plen_56_part_01